MTKKYIVSCYSPPNQLEIKSGQIARVEGWKTGNKIRAISIINMTKNGPTCNCGLPAKALIAEKVTLIGKVSNIRYSSEPSGVQFDLETE
jgi:hypothetical protein